MSWKYRPSAHRILESEFPNLSNSDWSIKSPQDDRYQCIAWAACKTDKKWWPISPDDFPVFPPDHFWPPGVPLNDMVDSFIQAFGTLGYYQCDNPSFEFGYQKIAIYIDSTGSVSHMARQSFWGYGWLSKLGPNEDILHPDLSNVSSHLYLNYAYGNAQRFLKRSWWTAFIRLQLITCAWHTFKFWCFRRVFTYRNRV